MRTLLSPYLYSIQYIIMNYDINARGFAWVYSSRKEIKKFLKIRIIPIDK